MTICSVILAGGSGSRLWPLSRAAHPKQFLNLNQEGTMLQETFQRLSGLDISSSVTICNEDHRFVAAEQLRQIDKSGSIILEPVERNTAPAIMLEEKKKKNDPWLLVLAADHIIQKVDAFTKTVKGAVPLAESGSLVTFGIVPDAPHTGYGYVKRGRERNIGFFVDEFVEKPSLEQAESYITSGKYYWNSGMFLFRASTYLKELKKFRPEIYAACEASMEELNSDLDFLRIRKDKFISCPSESVDYAVMENTKNAVVVPLDAGWSDVGSWSSLWDVSPRDDQGNALTGDVILHNTINSYVRSDSRLTVAVGLENLIIVSTKDAVMVVHKDNVQDVKIVVEKQKTISRSEWDLQREVYRPWGKYDCVDRGEGYQLKKLTVNPGAKLSVQMHYHRSEHWIVVAGKARVYYGDKFHDLEVNESTYHGKEVVHALENNEEIPLELIEIQVGCYLGEDDIVRFDDVYGRVDYE